MADKVDLQKILYSCYHQESRTGEQFVSEHVFSYQIAGTLNITIGNTVHTFRAGDFRFSKRNELAKFVKIPPEQGDFKSISVRLDQETLRTISQELNLHVVKKYEGNPIIALKPDVLYKSYVDSLMPYLELSEAENENLFSLKVKEAVMILLRAHPELKDILFDFTAPGKIDLEEYMMGHFHYNVKLERFAYMTGRSLATFKRDFEKIFHESPSKWLLQKRLEEAHFLIKEKGKKPSDIYMDVGFEDLSHFSYAFKNAFGYAPSRMHSA